MHLAPSLQLDLLLLYVLMGLFAIICFLGKVRRHVAIVAIT